MTSKISPSELTHSGAGTTLVMSYLALIPGVLPTLAIAGVITAVLLLPALALGLAVVVLIGPPYGLWRLATRSRVERNRK